MRDDDLALAATRRLPPAALAAILEAFEVEVAERLPVLQAAAASGHPALLGPALRAAHALGSSSAVVGQAEASSAARAVEAVLLGWQAGGALPVEALRAQVEALTTLLVERPR